jgi:hypothetical protein
METVIDLASGLEGMSRLSSRVREAVYTTKEGTSLASCLL